MFGQFRVDPVFFETFEAWRMTDFAPVPEHPKLEHYLPRRAIHLLKLCMIFSASRSNETILRLEDLREAQDFLIETEVYMPDVFRAMTHSIDGGVAILDETFNFVYMAYAKEKKGIDEHRIRHFIFQRAPQHTADHVLKNLIESRMIATAEVASTYGRPSYKPIPRIEHGH